MEYPQCTAASYIMRFNSRGSTGVGGAPGDGGIHAEGTLVTGVKVQP